MSYILSTIGAAGIAALILPSEAFAKEIYCQFHQEISCNEAKCVAGEMTPTNLSIDVEQKAAQLCRGSGCFDSQTFGSVIGPRGMLLRFSVSLQINDQIEWITGAGLLPATGVGLLQLALVDTGRNHGSDGYLFLGNA